MVNSRAKGLTAERTAANYFRRFPEWPNARRSVAAGWSTTTTEHQDEGDLIGVNPLCVQVKNLARPLAGKLLADVWLETCAQALTDNREPVILEKRSGHADPASWWLHLAGRFYVELVTGRRQFMTSNHLVRVELGHVVDDLRILARKGIDTH